MNIKRITVVGCAIALIGAMTATAFAGTVTGNGMFANKGQQATLTATQVTEKAATREARQADRVAYRENCQTDRVADREARQAEMVAASEKWDTLTDLEKESVYQVQEDKINAVIAIINEYLSLGLIDADRASEMKSDLTERIADLRTDGEFPLMGGFGKGGVEGQNYGRNHDIIRDRIHDRNLCTTSDEAVAE